MKNKKLTIKRTDIPNKGKLYLKQNEAIGFILRNKINNVHTGLAAMYVLSTLNKKINPNILYDVNTKTDLYKTISEVVFDVGIATIELNKNPYIKNIEFHSSLGSHGYTIKKDDIQYPELHNESKYHVKENEAYNENQEMIFLLGKYCKNLMTNTELGILMSSIPLINTSDEFSSITKENWMLSKAICIAAKAKFRAEESLNRIS